MPSLGRGGQTPFLLSPPPATLHLMYSYLDVGDCLTMPW